MFYRLFALMAVVVALVACAAPTPVTTPEESSAEPTEGRALVLGDISDDPVEVIEGAEPLANAIASQLAEYGITHGEVRVANDADEMAELLKSGEVDITFDSVYPAMLLSDASGAQPILRRWRNGVAEYHSVIFTMEGSGITEISDLDGRMVAMDNEYSTSGYVLPTVYLVEQGLTPAIKENYSALVPPDEVGIVFSFDDENTFQWVVNGYVDAGVTDDFHFGNFPADANLIKLAETESVPRQVVILRPGLDPDLAEAIKQVLLHIHESEEGQAALEAFDDTARFDEFPEGIEAALARMRELQAIIEEISGIKD